MSPKKLSPVQISSLFSILETRFQKFPKHHIGLVWSSVQQRLESKPEKLWSLNEMEITGGEPDVVGIDNNTGEYVFYDCSEETPKGRRSYCYDRSALEARKTFKPKNSAIELCNYMGIELLSEDEYRQLQELGKFDTKTSSWLLTPPAIRKLGGAIFADRRYDHVFVYHNGADSYYAVRGFRGVLRV